MRKIPSPFVNPETQAFWDAARQHRLMVPFCEDCGRTHWYPRAICPHCMSSKVELKPNAGTGRVYSFSIVPGADGYAMAYVQLDDGPTLLTNVIGEGHATLKIGQAVRVQFTPSEDGTPVPMFVVG